MHTSFAQTGHPIPDSVGTSDSVTPSMDLNKETASPPAKDESKDKTDSIQPEKLVLRQIPDTIVKKLAREKEFAYANDASLWKEEKVLPQRTFLVRLYEWAGTGWFRWFLYLVLGSLLLIVLYRVVVENRLFLFYAGPRKSTKMQESMHEDIRQDLDCEIRGAIAQYDYRSAVRYSYLKALQVAEEKHWIHRTPTDTNGDYIRQMHRHSQEKNFRFLTHVYEHVWYGNFLLNRSQFESVTHSFNQFYNHSGN
jgi:hypothetical protein